IPPSYLIGAQEKQVQPVIQLKAGLHQVYTKGPANRDFAKQPFSGAITMYWSEFLTIAFIHLLAVASPGPDFAVVVRESVLGGRRTGLFTTLGIGSGIFVH